MPAKKTVSPISIPLRRMTQAELDSFLEKAADILRGNVDHSEFRGKCSRCCFSSASSPARSA
jgi:type I restriction-modification system DNA methylase subunit